MTNCASNLSKLSNYKKHNFYVNGNTVSISRKSLKDFNYFSVKNVYIFIRYGIEIFTCNFATQHLLLDERNLSTLQTKLAMYKCNGGACEETCDSSKLKFFLFLGKKPSQY